ncbi:MAG: GIY-YIG nuclease family protein [Patescibacteria group bacterium]
MRGIVYILQSKKSGRYYIGSTGNLQERLNRHQQGNTATTRRMGHWTLVFSQEYATLAAARRIERKLKSWKRKDFIEKIISEKYIRVDDK